MLRESWENDVNCGNAGLAANTIADAIQAITINHKRHNGADLYGWVRTFVSLPSFVSVMSFVVTMRTGRRIASKVRLLTHTLPALRRHWTVRTPWSRRRAERIKSEFAILSGGRTRKSKNTVQPQKIQEHLMRGSKILYAAGVSEESEIISRFRTAAPSFIYPPICSSGYKEYLEFERNK